MEIDTLTTIPPQVYKTKLEESILVMERAVELGSKLEFLSAEREYLITKTIMYGCLSIEGINKVDIFDERYLKCKGRI